MLAPSWVHLAAGLAATYPGAVSSQACTAPLEQASLEAALQALQLQWPPSRRDCCDASAVAFLAPASCFFPPGGADVPLSSGHRCDASHASALRSSSSCGSSPWRARFPCARLARALHVRPEPFCSLKTMTAPGHAAATSDNRPTSVDAWRDPTSPLLANSAHSGRSHLLRAPLALQTHCQRHLWERLHAPSLLPGAQVLPVLRPLALREGPLSRSPLVVGSPARSNPRTPLAHKSTQRNRVRCLRSACCGACTSEKKDECERPRFQKECMDIYIYIIYIIIYMDVVENIYIYLYLYND